MSVLADDLANIYKTVNIETPGASTTGMKQIMFDTIFEFLKDSSSWQEQIVFTTAANTTSYPITPTGGQIIRLVSVIDPNGVPVSAAMPTLGAVLLQYAQNAGIALTATVIKNLDPGAGTDWDQIATLGFLAREWRQALIEGLQGRMMNQPGKSYSNETLALYHLKRYRDGINQARIATVRMNTQGTNAWRYPGGFGVRGQRGGTSVGGFRQF